MSELPTARAFGGHDGDIVLMGRQSGSTVVGDRCCAESADECDVSIIRVRFGRAAARDVDDVEE
jgi:hypothetical protein